LKRGLPLYTDRLDSEGRQLFRGLVRPVNAGIVMAQESYAMPFGKMTYKPQDAQPFAGIWRVWQFFIDDDDVHECWICSYVSDMRDNPARTPIRGRQPIVSAAAVQSNSRRPMAERSR
jgi:hypothetical protein